MKQLTLSEIQAVSGGLSAGQITLYVGSAASAITSYSAQRLLLPGKNSQDLIIGALVIPFLQIFSNAVVTETCTKFFENLQASTKANEA